MASTHRPLHSSWPTAHPEDGAAAWLSAVWVPSPSLPLMLEASFPDRSDSSDSASVDPVVPPVEAGGGGASSPQPATSPTVAPATKIALQQLGLFISVSRLSGVPRGRICSTARGWVPHPRHAPTPWSLHHCRARQRSPFAPESALTADPWPNQADSRRSGQPRLTPQIREQPLRLPLAGYPTAGARRCELRRLNTPYCGTAHFQRRFGSVRAGRRRGASSP